MEKTEMITGTFIDEITYDIPSSNWSYDDWKKDLDNMKSVGIDTLIFIRGGFENKMIYPSKHFPCIRDDDFAGFVFEESAKRNMNVFMGLYISNIDWNNGDAQGEIHKNKIFIDEVYERYGDCPSFKGWYLPHETHRDMLNITEIFNGLSYLCKERTPEKQIMISPVIPSKLTTNEPLPPNQFYEEWNGIFAKSIQNIDICAFQDGSAPLEQMMDYLNYSKKLCDEYNIEHWVNVETFERDPRCMYYPISFEVLKKKLELIKPISDKMITFEFSHFLSPQSIYPSARNLFKRYTELLGKEEY